MSDALHERLLRLHEQHVALARELEDLRKRDTQAQLDGLEELMRRQRKVGDETRSVRNRLRRELRAATELERLERLRTTNTPDPDDVALALLRGGWTRARDALARATGHFGALARTIAKDLTRLMDGGPVAIKHLESAVQRLERAEELKQVGSSLRGALLVQLGRFYRDELQSAHMAANAFRRAGEVLPDQPEPLIERAELLRRAGRLDPAQEMFTHATRIGPQRAGGWIGLALVAEARSAAEDCAQHARRAIEIVRRDAKPLDILRRVQPAPCSAVFVELARQSVDTPEIARAAYDEAIRSCAQPTMDVLSRLHLERAELSVPPDAVDLCEAGRLALWRGDYATATELLRRATQSRPGYRLAAAYLADAHRLRASELQDATVRKQELRQGLAMSCEAIAAGPLQPGDAWILLIHTRIFEALVEDGAMSDETLWEALRHCEHGLVLEPMNASCLARAAHLHHGLGNRATARYSAELAEAIAPTNVEAVSTLFWLYAVTGEHQRALRLVPRLPDSVWRRSIEAYLRVRYSRDQASLEIARDQLSGPRASDVGIHSWMPIVAGHCFRLLGQEELAKAEFEHALGSSRMIDRVEAYLALERYAEVCTLCEAQADKVRYRCDEDLIGSLVVSYLALGNLDDARAAFSRIARLVRGPAAANWIITFEQDLQFHEAFRNPLPGVAEQRARFIMELHKLAAEPERRTPRGELDRALEVPDLLRIPREALRLARVRIAIDGRHDPTVLGADESNQDLIRSLHLVDSIEQSQERADALCRVSAWCAATAAERAESGLVEIALAVTPQTRERVWEFVSSAGQAARLVDAAPELWEAAATTGWIERHLGLDAPQSEVVVAPLIVSMPGTLFPADDTHNTWPFITTTIPDVRKTIEDRWGIVIPPVHIHRGTQPSEAGVWVNEENVGNLSLDTSEASPPSGNDRADLGRLAQDIMAGHGWSKTLGISQQTYVGAWLVNRIAEHLAALMEPDVLVRWVDASPEIDTRSFLTDTGSLLRLWRLVRGLLREHVPLKSRAQVMAAARRGRTLSHEAFLNQARRFVYVGLCEELHRRFELQPESQLIARVPIAIEETVLARVRHDGKRAFLALPHRDTAGILAQLRPAMVGDAPAVFCVTESEARPWIQQLVNLERPDAIVISSSEQAQYLRWATSEQDVRER